MTERLSFHPASVLSEVGMAEHTPALPAPPLPLSTEQEYICPMALFCTSPGEGPLWRRMCLTIVLYMTYSSHLPCPLPAVLTGLTVSPLKRLLLFKQKYFFLNSLQALVVCLQLGGSVSACFVVQQGQNYIRVKGQPHGTF